MPQLDYKNYTKNTEGLLEDEDLNLNDEYKETSSIRENTIGTIHKSQPSTTSTYQISSTNTRQNKT